MDQKSKIFVALLLLAACCAEAKSRRARYDVFRTDKSMPNTTTDEDPQPQETVKASSDRSAIAKDKVPKKNTLLNHLVKPFEVFHVEHITSYNDSRRTFVELKKLKEYTRAPYGCTTCTDEEMHYCYSKVINDHCCCDKKYSEAFNWIPHTCYVGPGPCFMFAPDCETYAALRDCCCKEILFNDWNLRYGRYSSHAKANYYAARLIILTLFLILLCFLRILGF